MIYGMKYKKEYINFETIYIYIYYIYILYIYIKGKITIVDTNVDA